MAVELVPNTEKYEDIYPESGSDSDDDCDSDDYDSENDESFRETSHIKALVQKGKEIDDKMEEVEEEKRSRDAQMAILKVRPNFYPRMGILT